MVPTSRRAEYTLAPALHGFTRDELLRLMSIEATMAAEQYLVPLGQPCADHEACRRLAFGLWLCLTRRIAENTDG